MLPPSAEKPACNTAPVCPDMAPTFSHSPYTRQMSEGGWGELIESGGGLQDEILTDLSVESTGHEMVPVRIEFARKDLALVSVQGHDRREEVRGTLDALE